MKQFPFFLKVRLNPLRWEFWKLFFLLSLGLFLYLFGGSFSSTMLAFTNNDLALVVVHFCLLVSSTMMCNKLLKQHLLVLVFQLLFIVSPR